MIHYLRRSFIYAAFPRIGLISAQNCQNGVKIKKVYESKVVQQPRIGKRVRSDLTLEVIRVWKLRLTVSQNVFVKNS